MARPRRTYHHRASNQTIKPSSPLPLPSFVPPHFTRSILDLCFNIHFNHSILHHHHRSSNYPATSIKHQLIHPSTVTMKTSFVVLAGAVLAIAQDLSSLPQCGVSRAFLMANALALVLCDALTSPPSKHASTT